MKAVLLAVVMGGVVGPQVLPADPAKDQWREAQQPSEQQEDKMVGIDH